MYIVSQDVGVVCLAGLDELSSHILQIPTFWS